MYGKSLEVFFHILQNCEDAELFIVVKSAFLSLQILVDSQYLEPAKLLITKLEEFLPYIKKVINLKKSYKSTVTEDEKTSNGSTCVDKDG